MDPNVEDRQMFDFGNANEAQREAIEAADGPVLMTAGPGTGKTYTLVQLLQVRGLNKWRF